MKAVIFGASFLSREISGKTRLWPTPRRRTATMTRSAHLSIFRRRNLGIRLDYSTAGIASMARGTGKRDSYPCVFIVITLILTSAPAASSQDSGSVTGVVRQADKSSVENALVKISGDLLPGGRTLTTARDGLVRFRGRTTGDQHLRPTH